MRMRWTKALLTLGPLAAIIGLYSPTASASSGGVDATDTYKGCACHSGGAGTTYIGIAKGAASTSSTYSVTNGTNYFTAGVAATIYPWVSNSSLSKAGFRVKASTGTFSSPGSNTELCVADFVAGAATTNTCITQNASATLTAYFSATYTPPGSTGSVTFSMSGNAVDGTSGTGLDKPTADTTFTVPICSSAQHACSGACVSNSSTNTCGTSCSACSYPTNGSPTCNGSSCGYNCNTNYHKCSSSYGCFSDTSTTACGSSCVTCSAPTGGSAVCSGGACTFNCNSGYHKCPSINANLCYSNSSTATCGANCSPCTPPSNATATCNGSTCDFTCNTNYARSGSACVANNTPSCCTTGNVCPSSGCTAPANGTAICSSGTCDFTCNSGYTRSGSTCVQNGSTSCCGSSCSTCKTLVGNAVPACVAGACTFECSAGYAKDATGTTCVKNNTPTCCTTSNVCPSKICATDPNGAATCNSGTCGVACNAGFNNCGGSCKKSTDTAACGASCLKCVAPANGTPTCDGSKCGFTCNTGYVLDATGTACEPSNSTSCCGTACAKCTVGDPSTETAVCNAGKCEIQCQNGYLRCNNKCSSMKDFAWYPDKDGDGHGDKNSTSADIKYACEQPDGYSKTNDDCRDDDKSVSPSAPEQCNSIDDNCDGNVDENITPIKQYPDSDNDGFGDATATEITDCLIRPGFSLTKDDCNDKDPNVHPKAKELCNGIDDNCNGQKDEGFGKLTCGKGACAASVDECVDGKTQTCTEGTPKAETCNGIDDNCDGTVDEGSLCSPGQECKGTSGCVTIGSPPDAGPADSNPVPADAVNVNDSGGNKPPEPVATQDVGGCSYGGSRSSFDGTLLLWAGLAVGGIVSRRRRK